MKITFYDLVYGPMEIRYETFNFNGGEPHVKLNEDGLYYISEYELSIGSYFNIELNIKSSDDLINLLLVTDVLKRFLVKKELKFNINAIIKYFPAARQDRQTHYNEPFSLKVYTDIINAQNYNKVTIWDAHSDVTTALLNNCVNIKQVELVSNIFNRDLVDVENLVLCSPDAGANKKIFEISKKYNIPVIRSDKIRDTKTGNITETVVYSEHLGNKDILIVDDILDGGGTFIPLAKKLEDLTEGNIYLYVTHGIFAKGLYPFEGLIDKIFCPNILLDNWEEKNSLGILREF